MVIYIAIPFVILMLIKAYRLGVVVERTRWKYGEHFIENSISYRFAKSKDGGRSREIL